MASLIGSGLLLLLAFFAVLLFLHFVPLGLWISALAADVNVGILTLVGMRMRRVPPVRFGISNATYPDPAASPGRSQRVITSADATPSSFARAPGVGIFGSSTFAILPVPVRWSCARLPCPLPAKRPNDHPVGFHPPTASGRCQRGTG